VPLPLPTLPTLAPPHVLLDDAVVQLELLVPKPELRFQLFSPGVAFDAAFEEGEVGLDEVGRVLALALACEGGPGGGTGRDGGAVVGGLGADLCLFLLLML
jgi:hypothetical protein